jgi:hypothetical protein
MIDPYPLSVADPKHPYYLRAAIFGQPVEAHDLYLHAATASTVRTAEVCQPHSSTVGIIGMADRAAEKAGNELHGDRSRDHFVANILDTVATVGTARIANIADTEYPRTESRREHIPVPECLGQPRRADQKVQLPRKMFSSDCPPPKRDNENI